MQKTLVIIKPDAVYRGLVGEIITRLERKHMKIINMRKMQLTSEQVDCLYEEHEYQPWYVDLKRMMMNGESIVMSVTKRSQCDWDDVVEQVISIVGTYRHAGTIRGDFASSPRHNCVHRSDSIAAAERELAIFGL